MSNSPLVTTEWLAENLDNPGVKILDATYMMAGWDRDADAEYRLKHIPGAVRFDIDDVADPASDLPHMMPSQEMFGEKVGALGISNSDTVVIYDAHGGFLAGVRAWWMFRAFGHSDVVLLDGSLPKWEAEDRPLERGPVTLPPTTFNARYRPALIRNAQQILGNISSGQEQLVDARAEDRFDGSAEEIWPGRRLGHIPGSLNLPFMSLLNPEDKTFRPAAEIRQIIENAGIDMDRPVVTTCGSGVTACVIALALHLVGKQDDISVYDGSWSEWGLPGDLPTETGPAKRPAFKAEKPRI